MKDFESDFVRFLAEGDPVVLCCRCCLDYLADESRDVMKPAGSCDCSTQQGEAFADVSVCAAHNGYGRTNGGQDGHYELNDVLNRFLFHGIWSPPLIPQATLALWRGAGGEAWWKP